MNPYCSVAYRSLFSSSSAFAALTDYEITNCWTQHGLQGPLIHFFSNKVTSNRCTITAPGFTFDAGKLAADAPVLLEVLSQMLRNQEGYIQCLNELSLYGEMVTVNHEVVANSRTSFFIPIAGSGAEQIQVMARDSRTRLRKLIRERSSYRLIELKSIEHAIILGDLYKALADRQNFSPHYVFRGKEVFEPFLDSEKWNLFGVIDESQQVIGGCLCCLHTSYRQLDYVFTMYEPDKPFLGRLIPYLLTEWVRNFSSGSEISYLALGGGIYENDPLARFKRSLGGEARELTSLKFYSKYGSNLLERRLYYNNRWPQIE